MNRYFRILFLLVLALSGVGVWAADKKVTLQLRWTPQFQFAGYYVALEKGFYKDEGLDVQIIPGEGNRTQVMEEVLSGRADFGIGNSGLALASLNGEQVTVLADIFQRSASVLLVKPGLETSIPQLGHRNLALRSLRDNPELYAVFQRFGMSPTHLPRLSTSKYDLDAFIRGDFDAINAYISNEPFILKEKGIPYKIIDPVDFGINFYGDALFTRTGYIANNHELVQAFVRATIRGWKYALDQKAETIALLQAGPARHLSKEQLTFEASAIESLIMADVIPIGNVNPDRWQRIAATFKSLGLANPAAVLPEDFFIGYWVDHSNRHKLLFWAGGLGLLFVLILVAYFWQRKIAGQLALAVKEKASLVEQVEQLANHDFLTGLPNRRLLEERLDRAIAYAARYRTQFAICYIDLNGFKAINDVLGHDGGDQVLIYTAGILQKSLRESDTVARIGGDEFVILLDLIESENDVQALQARLQESFAKPFAYKDTTTQIKFSLGFSIYPADGQSTKLLLQVADIAMYQSKGG